MAKKKSNKEVTTKKEETMTVDEIIRTQIDFDEEAEKTELSIVTGKNDLINNLYKVEYFAQKYHQAKSNRNITDTVETIEWNDGEALEYLIEKFEPKTDRQRIFVQLIADTLALLGVDKNDLIGYFEDNVIMIISDEEEPTEDTEEETVSEEQQEVVAEIEKDEIEEEVDEAVKQILEEVKPLSPSEMEKKLIEEADVIANRLEILLDDIKGKDVINILAVNFSDSREFVNIHKKFNDLSMEKFKLPLEDAYKQKPLDVLKMMDLDEYKEIVKLFSDEDCRKAMLHQVERASALDSLFKCRFETVYKSVSELLTSVQETKTIKDDGVTLATKIREKMKKCPNNQVRDLFVHMALTTLNVDDAWEFVEFGEMDRLKALTTLKYNDKINNIKTESDLIKMEKKSC